MTQTDTGGDWYSARGNASVEMNGVALYGKCHALWLDGGGRRVWSLDLRYILAVTADSGMV